MSLEQFKASKAGAALAPVLQDAASIALMEQVSRADRPAVEAVGREVERRVGSLTDTEKKLVGRWIREILAPRGWTPRTKGRVRAGNFFSRGTIYRRVGNVSATRDAGAGAGLRRARALVADLAEPPLSVDAMIAQRRAERER